MYATALTVALTIPAFAASEKILWNFAGEPNDGSTPQVAGLLAGKGGVYYGTTSAGGIYNVGTVYSLTPPAKGQTNWTEEILWNFTGGENGPVDGMYPDGNVISDVSGALYGTTVEAGAYGAGTVYRLTPPVAGQTQWTEEIVWSFGERRGTGVSPVAGLVSVGSPFYGTASAVVKLNGLAGYGTVFELLPPLKGQTAWREQDIWEFSGPPNDGAYPSSSLIADASGALYGTADGGANDAGVVFKLTPPAKGQTKWTEEILWNFCGSTCDQPNSNGLGNDSLTMDASGNLYGATLGGGTVGFGTIFELSPPAGGQRQWTESILYSFAGGSDGATPNGVLLSGSDLYGTTSDLGALGFYGTIFKLAPGGAGSPWIKTIFHSFAGYPTDGSSPAGNLVMDKTGALYGTTATGGTIASGGTVYKVVP